MAYCTTDWYVSNRLGVATDTPCTDLHVAGANAILRVGPYYNDGDRDYFEIRPRGLDTLLVTANESMTIRNCGGTISLMPASNVGIGSTSPSQVLEIVKDQAATTTLLLQNTSDQANAATEIRLYGNEGVAPLKNNQQISFVRGSGGTDWALGQPANSSDFVIAGGTNQGDGKPSLGTAERIRITSGGNVGIGTASPGYKLTISDTAATKLSLCGGTAQNGITFEKAGSGCSYYIFNGDYANLCGFGIYNVNTAALPMFINNSSNVGINTSSPSYRLHVNGTFYAAGSSIKYKEGICQYDTDSCLFMCLKPVTYQYKDEWQHLGRELKSQSQIGLIAEDVAQVMPELAILVNEEDEKVVRNVDYEKLSVVLLKEVQKLRQEVDELKNNK